jgi:hypothetical protein
MSLSPNMASYLAEDDFSQSTDKLTELTNQMKLARDLKFSILQKEEELKYEKKKLNELIQKTLPDLMSETNQTILRLPKEGNYPPFIFKLKPYYAANISNDNPDAPEAYQWLDDHGEGDLIKRTITTPLGKESQELQELIISKLEDLGVDYDIKYGVHPQTLTAWLKNRHQRYLDQQKRLFEIKPEDRIEMPPLDLFGAYVGHSVEIKPEKE